MAKRTLGGRFAQIAQAKATPAIRTSNALKLN
jgi:hypothetical protein